MATRNPANVIVFGEYNYGATMTEYTVTATATIVDQINPGEEMEKVMEAMVQRGTWIGLSTLSNSDKTFSVTMENSSWADAAEVQVALRLIGGNFTLCTVV
tara:strand:- start:99 stop:401 length:303 start_codon:yes stop_codon:yes gene_type:complete